MMKPDQRTRIAGKGSAPQSPDLDGPSSDEAQKLLFEHGENVIEEKRTSPFRKLFTYFWGPIPWMIEHR